MKNLNVLSQGLFRCVTVYHHHGDFFFFKCINEWQMLATKVLCIFTCLCLMRYRNVKGITLNLQWRIRTGVQGN